MPPTGADGLTFAEECVDMEDMVTSGMLEEDTAAVEVRQPQEVGGILIN